MICEILLSNGKKKSFYVLGGYSSSKKQRGTLFEVGHVLNFNLKIKRKNNQFSFIDEYRLKFAHENIRYHIRAYYLLMIFLKSCEVISLEQIDEDRASDESQLYRICSNAIYFLDKHPKSNIYTHLFCFLTKVCIYSGVFPDLSHCGYCNKDISQERYISLIMHEGYFSCANCGSETNRTAFEIRRLLIYFAQTPYSSVDFGLNVDTRAADRFFDFFLFHHHIHRNQLNIPRDFI
ncbi:DNA repair protein RecO C-terminal domain-containing protein [Bacteriovoracaceae bacterium]|nr:DNA repair protein RecO C-terminal domain-containing protein [Bacteriovoracaceae bacterium]